MAYIDLFDNQNFHGEKLTLSESASDLRAFHHAINGDWNDETSSFRVASGTWVLYEDVNYGGLASREFHAGDAIANCLDAGFPNNWVSSVQKIRD